MVLPVSARAFPFSNEFKLGLFSFNTYGGLTNTLAPERWQANWPNMQKLALDAEAAGLEFLLPLAGWIGRNGQAETDGYFHETLTWATGLLAATKSIHVFATIHVPFLSPVFTAKAAMTADHVGAGRLGLNLLAGYNVAEFDMFACEFLSQEDRYAYLQEWLSVVRGLWCEEDAFDFKGHFFDLAKLRSWPKPFGSELPLVVSAGSSPAGRQFALENADALFMVVIDPDSIAAEIATIRQSMASRPINIYCSGHVICRQSAAETRDYYNYLIHENGDWAAGEFMRDSYAAMGSAPDEVLNSSVFLQRLMSGHGTLPIIGDPSEVADQIAHLHGAGLNGMAMALPNYLEDFEIFRVEVLPRLVERGIRAD